MIRAKNYETVSKFVEVMTKILWPLFFPDTVYRTYIHGFITRNTVKQSLNQRRADYTIRSGTDLVSLLDLDLVLLIFLVLSGRPSSKTKSHFKSDRNEI